MNLFICADPGARAHTVAAWLQDQCHEPVFEPGIVLEQKFQKAHTDWGNDLVRSHKGIRIRIRPSFAKMATHMWLFLVKNVYTTFPDFSRNHFDIETATKVTESAKYWLQHDQQIDNDLYDIVIRFEDTFDINILTELYVKIHNRPPADTSLAVIDRINHMNDPWLDPNHACSISAMVLKQEHEMGVEESDRFWSMPDLYRDTPQHMLCTTILSNIKHENYGAYWRQKTYD